MQSSTRSLGGRPVDVVTARSADPIALNLFEQLRWLTDEDQRVVLRTLDARLAGVTDDRLQLVRFAVERFVAETGDSLSKKKYERWRTLHADRASLPSATAIATAFGGSWAKAMDGLGLEPDLEHIARRLRSRGPRADDQEVLDALRTCAGCLSKTPTFDEYKTWARAQLRGAHGPRVLLLAEVSFIRRFGSWRGAIVRAGLPVLRAAHGPHGPIHHYSTDEILARLREANDALNPAGWLTAGAYDRWRASELETDACDGDGLKVVPASSCAALHFGTWAKALVAAGLITAAQEGALFRGAGRSFSSVAIADALRAAVRVNGDEMTRTEYERWRASELARDPFRSLPSASLLRSRFGGWNTMLDAIRQATPE